MRFPHAFLQELRLRNPIADVISTHVALRRAGANLVGLCPFHNEKTPSFTVFLSDPHFHCFGCGAGGDVVTFVMMAENLDYPDAVAYLANRAGLSLPETEDGLRAEEGPTVPRKRILELNRDAARYFHNLLKTPAGKPGLDYWHSRGLSDSVIIRFGLGYQPDRDTAFVPAMKELGYTEEELVAGFLCGKSKSDGTLYPVFRRRVIVPVIDPSGSVVAFGGRVLDDSKPKYLNSSDTPAFRKTKTLYGLNFAKDACAEQIVLCEGYMDVIAVQAAGVMNAVATLGTAITAEHARILARYTKEVVIAYDMDEAGRRAVERAIRLLDSVGLPSKILNLENAKDPDEYIRRFGADRFRMLLEGSENQFDYRCGRILKAHNLDDFNDRLAAVSELTELLATLPTEVQRDLYAARYADALSVKAESLIRDANRAAGRARRKETAKSIEADVRVREGYGDEVNRDRIRNLRAAVAEETILGVLFHKPELLSSCAAGFDNPVQLKAEDFFTEFGKRVFTRILEADAEHGGFDLSDFNGDFTVEEVGRLSGLEAARAALSVNDAAILSENVKTLREEVRRQNRGEEDLLGEIGDLIAAKRDRDRKS